METLEYRKLISTLDAQLDRAKLEAEVKVRREQLETHIKLVTYQMEQLRIRKEQFDKLGVASAVDLNPILEKLAYDKAAFEQQLQDPPPVPMPEKGVDQADRDRLVTLLREIEGTVLAGVSPEERWLKIEYWAIAWRFIVDRVGQNSMSQDRLFSKVYATIRSMMDREPESPYRNRANEPLTRPKPGTVSGTNWDERIRAVELRLLELQQARFRDEEQARGIEKDMQGFSTAFTNHQADSNPETDRALRHAVRTAARHVHLRSELADALLPYRAAMGEEFRFLWDEGTADDEEEAAKKTLSNRDIAARILRRMKSKAMIGACHCPEDMISRGFPPHYVGKAKEIIDILVKMGVIRRKDNVGELRVSIEPPALPQIEAFLAGACMGIRDVDAWCAE